MTPTSLLLNNNPFSYEQIRSGKWISSSPFEESTLSFCQQWLTGQEEFKQQTSGSTGKPKSINITRAQMIISAQNTIGALKLNPSDTALVCIDTAYIGGKMMLVRAFEHKLQLIIIEPLSNPLENITGSIDFIAMVPLQFENSLKNYPKKIANCKAIIIGGAPINNSLAQQIASLKTPIYSTYGMTETTSHIALKRLSNPAEDYFTTIGDVKISTNQLDQLIINGAITNNKELTTNDRVSLLSPTTFNWLGRIDNVINSGGVKIQLEEVESKIKHYFDENNVTNRFFLYGIPDDKLGTKLILCIEEQNITIPLNKLIYQYIGLNKWSYPKEVIYINNFTETSLGKIQRTESYNFRKN